MSDEPTRQRPADSPREQTLPLPDAVEPRSPPPQPADDRDSELELEPTPPQEVPPPYPGSPIPSYWAPWAPAAFSTSPQLAPAQVVHPRPYARRGSIVGTSVSAIGALGALVAFCVLPYVDAVSLGSFTGPQVATVLAAVSASTASGSATPGQTFSPTTLASLLWAEAALAVIAGAVALWQIAHRANNGRPISTLVTLVVLSASCASLLILGFQYVWLQSSTATKVAAAYLGSGFWGTVAGMVVVAVGAMVQISA